MRSKTRFLFTLLAQALSFKEKAEALEKATKVEEDRYPNGFNKSREEARRRKQIEAQARRIGKTGRFE